ncbi:hypothetical protein OG2516_17555 [Oceanicola granulosus HTCC2516]|uniref:Carbohydrate kinase PfkB domain-containing protein n=1 Tax=Oceanicola granulosus (strain ATCC BAA-861 / DSM 15982 / KCTC 12143 / HTCC2516) TaxID=314256 RepID=Q2CF69_OCEGH|nr:PfkB family carbohydrate kinase [Oceanicola granulosus]EAR51258.1 hypothetical protein OG2516_17555 [Oceanicola granulosus HTCC2516]
MSTPRVVTFGDNVVDCYVGRGEMYPGGNAVNVAAHLSRFGARAAYCGAVGDDPAGRHVRDSLRDAGVETTRLRMGGGPTAFCLIGHEEGDRVFLGADLGVSIIAPEAEDLSAIAQGDAVHTGRSSRIEPHLADLAERARLSYDFAVVRDADRIGRIAPLCFLASFSGGDLSDGEAEELARSAREAGADWVLVTLGGRGALLAGPGGMHRAEAVAADLVDTLGAGDTFIARVLFGLLTEEAPETLLRAAAREAAQTCSRYGGFGPAAPIAVDRSRAKSLSEIYSTETTVRA